MTSVEVEIKDFGYTASFITIIMILIVYWGIPIGDIILTELLLFIIIVEIISFVVSLVIVLIVAYILGLLSQ